MFVGINLINFYDIKFAFEYNILRLQTVEIPMIKLQALKNCLEAMDTTTKKQMAYIPVYTLQRGLIYC